MGGKVHCVDVTFSRYSVVCCGLDINLLTTTRGTASCLKIMWYFSWSGNLFGLIESRRFVARDCHFTQFWTTSVKCPHLHFMCLFYCLPCGLLLRDNPTVMLLTFPSSLFFMLVSAALPLWRNCPYTAESGREIKKRLAGILGAFAKLALSDREIYVWPYAWNYSAPSGRIFMKFDISVFFKNL